MSARFHTFASACAACAIIALGLVICIGMGIAIEAFVVISCIQQVLT